MRSRTNAIPGPDASPEAAQIDIDEDTNGNANEGYSNALDTLSFSGNEKKKHSKTWYHSKARKKNNKVSRTNRKP